MTSLLLLFCILFVALSMFGIINLNTKQNNISNVTEYHWFTGSLKEIITHKNWVLFNWMNKYGKIYSFYFFFFKFYVITDIYDAKNILSSDICSYRSIIGDLMVFFVGKYNLVYINDKKIWKKHNKILSHISLFSIARLQYD